MRNARSEHKNLVPMAGDASLAMAMLGGLFLLLSGGFHLLLALLALTGDNQNALVTTQKYALQMNVHTWGWIHLVLGVVAVVVGAGILLNRGWAFVLGLVVAFLSAIGNFAFLPHSPVWAAMMLAFDVVVIWALARELGDRD